MQIYYSCCINRTDQSFLRCSEILSVKDDVESCSFPPNTAPGAHPLSIILILILILLQRGSQHVAHPLAIMVSSTARV
jgi:hypothetical protein